MRINVLQHTPNEGPGSIKTWADQHTYDFYVYHPYQFGILPTADETDMLVLLGGPMSPNDNLPWIKQERTLVRQMMDLHKPMYGACFGAQQIAMTAGAKVVKAPHKEVGWAPIYLQTARIQGLPKQATALHWHEDMFEIPDDADLLFSSDLVQNQGFILGDNIIGLQPHLEPETDNIKEMAVNDNQYALDHNALNQTPEQIIAHGVPAENQQIMFTLLDFINR